MDAVMGKTLRAAAPADQDAQWRAVVARDASANGTFVYSVRSTGVYCRPSCPSRLAKRANVQFHASPKDAERAGFRPCKRCKPDQPGLAEQQAAKVAEACRFIEAADCAPSLDELAKRARMSAFHFHRVFKATTGVTPAAYARGERAKRMREGLSSRQQSVTQSIYEAGFNSNSRFYEKSDELLGMKPSEYRAGGANNAIHFSVGECSLGSILIARSERGVCAIFLGNDPEMLVHDLEDRFPNAELIGGDKDFETLVAKVVGFVEAPRTGLDLPLDVRHTTTPVAAAHGDHRERPVALRPAHPDRHVNLVAREHERVVHRNVRASHRPRDDVAVGRQFGRDVRRRVCQRMIRVHR